MASFCHRQIINRPSHVMKEDIASCNIGLMFIPRKEKLAQVKSVYFRPLLSLVVFIQLNINECCIVLYFNVLMGWSLLPKCTTIFLRSIVLPEFRYF